MNKSGIVARLREIEVIVSECLKYAGDEGPARIRRQRTASNHGNTLPERILRLRDDSFFKQGRTANEVQAKLRPDYDCELNRVEVTLHRLQKRRKLRRVERKTGDGKHVAYVS